MKTLAIDTSSEVCSTAILEDNNLIDENNLDNGKTHSENLMPLIQELLNRNNLKTSDIDLIACSVGPGSFTGIRIGVSSIKPIAEVLNIPVASVTSLETLARNIEKENYIRDHLLLEKRDEITIISLIDARNDQVYCGIFDEKYIKKEDYIADDINFVIEEIKEYKNIVCVGNGAILHKDLIKQKIKNVEFIENNKQSAVNVGKIGYKKFLDKDLYTADTIMPIYLRKSQAERMKK